MATAANILIRLGVDIASLREGFDAANKKVDNFGAAIGKVGNVLKAAAGFFVVSEIAGYINRLTDLAGGYSEVAESVGVATTSFQAYVLTVGEAGVSQEQFQKSLINLSKNINEATEGNKEAIERFKQLGVNILDTNGKLKPTEEILRLVAKALLEVEDPAKRVALAQQMLGKAGAASIPALQELSKSVDDLKAKFGRGIIPEEVSKQIDEFKDRMATNAKIFDAAIVTTGWELFQRVIEATKPFIDDLVEAFRDLLNVIDTTNAKSIFDFWGELFLMFAQVAIVHVTGVIKILADVIFWLDTLGPRLRIVAGFFEVMAADAITSMWNLREQLVKTFSDAFDKITANMSTWVKMLPSPFKELFTVAGYVFDLNIRINYQVQPLPEDVSQLLGMGRDRIAAARSDLITAEINRQIGTPSAPPPVTSGGIRPINSGGSLPPVRPSGGGGKEKISDEQKALDKYNESLADMYERFTQLIDPTARFYQQASELSELLINKKITEGEFHIGMQKIREEMDKVAAKAHPFADTFRDIFKSIESYAKKLSDTFIDVISGAMEITTANVKEAVGTMLRELARLVFYQAIVRPFTNWLSGGIADVIGIPLARRAAGGPVSAGQSYMVGEFGPERFTPTMSGTIDRAGSWGEGDTNVTINIAGVGSGEGPDSRQAVELGRRIRTAVLDVIRSEKRPGGLLAT
jgi:hypothetical protein